jgi:hypothetical protein
MCRDWGRPIEKYNQKVRAVQEFCMPQYTMKIAADPKQVADLKRFIEEHAHDVGGRVDTSVHALERDSSILQIVLTAVTTQAIGLMFSLIKDYVAGQLKKPDKPAFAIQIGNLHLSIKEETDLAVLDDVELSETEDVTD